MNRRSFLSTLAALPVVGRWFKADDVRVEGDPGNAPFAMDAGMFEGDTFVAPRCEWCSAEKPVYHSYHGFYRSFEEAEALIARSEPGEYRIIEAPFGMKPIRQMTLTETIEKYGATHY